MNELLSQVEPVFTRGDTNVELVAGILMFVVAGALLALAPLILGAMVRSTRINPEKAEPYECGEPVIGQSWVQFDLRFYIVALFFIIFDVEIALLWPWAVIYKEYIRAGAGLYALLAMLFFLVPILIGFAYEWRFGYLDWVRATTGGRGEPGDTAMESRSAA